MLLLALAVFAFGGTAYASETPEGESQGNASGLSQATVEDPGTEVPGTSGSMAAEESDDFANEANEAGEQVELGELTGKEDEARPNGSEATDLQEDQNDQEGVNGQSQNEEPAEVGSENEPDEADGVDGEAPALEEDPSQTTGSVAEEPKENENPGATAQTQTSDASATSSETGKSGDKDATRTTATGTASATESSSSSVPKTTSTAANTETNAKATSAKTASTTVTTNTAAASGKGSANSMPAQTFTGTANGVTASVVAPEGAFPKGTKMFVTAVAASKVASAVKGALGQGEVINDMTAIDITFKNAKGVKIEPLKPVSVTLRSALVQTANKPTIMHISDEGSATVIAGKKASANTMAFESDSFSAYVVADASASYFVIVIDPGHGGYDSGASDYVEEKGVNLSIAKYLKAELEKLAGVKVYMTRTDDTYVALQDRVQKAVNWKANLVVSIHNNSGGGSGCEVLVPNSSSWCYQDCYVKGTELGNNITAELVKLGLGKHGSGLVYRDCTTGDTYPDGSLADYYTLVSGPRENKILGVIIEHAFVDSYSDSRYLIGDSNLQKLAKADAAGIAKTFKLSSVPTNVNSQAAVNTKVVYSAAKTGTQYNYVWRYGTTWDLWGSTVKSTGKYTTAKQGSFTPTKTGTYYVWVDIIDAAGKKVTSRETPVNVWNLNSISVKTSAIKGTSLAITPKVSGSASGLKYNYFWSYGGKSYSSAYTTKTSYSIKPTATGTYNVWVTTKDAYGNVRSSGKRAISVWTLDVQIDKTAVAKGDAITIKPIITGSAPGVTYNYVWRLGTTWDKWGSTVKSTGKQTTAKTGQVRASSVGTYYLWVDAVDSNGNKATSQKKTCISTGDWKIMGTNASGPYYLLAPVTYSANVRGSKVDLSYNYVWRYGSTWDSWDSTVKSTGSMTTATTGSFTPTKAGTYYVWVDVKDNDGNKGTTPAVAVPVSNYKVKVNATAKTGNVVNYQLTAAPASGLTYNYVWRYGDTWDDWGSTVKSTGATTTAKYGSFTAKKPGTYYVWVDVKNSRNQVISSTAPVKVSLSWSVSGVSAPKSVSALDSIKYSANVSGDTSGLTYNYVWRYGDTWDEWGSNVRWTGKLTSARPGATQARKLGTYYVWVDVKDKYGNSVTTKAAAVTSANYAVRVSSNGKVGNTVSFRVVPEARSGLTYNYAWRYGDTWDEWGSTVKSTGKTTTAKNGTFVPTKAGKYYVWADVKDRWGHTVTTKASTVTLTKTGSAANSSGYAIMGSSTATAAQMVSYYKNTGATYPSSVYSSKGAASINDFANIVVSEAKAEGVRAEVVFAQSMLETGNLRYGGDVSASQCNFAGIGATGGGVKGATFANVRQGIRAQVQHLKAYASTSSLNNACVDPRFQYVTRGSATTVEALSGKWATSTTYGSSIVTIINKIKSY